MPLDNILVQQPTRFEMTVNRKTAATLGIVRVGRLPGAADEVIE